MEENFKLFKKGFGAAFTFVDGNGYSVLRKDKTIFDLKKIELSNVPNSYIFDNCELIGLYFNGSTKVYIYEFLTEHNSNLYSFRFSLLYDKFVYLGASFSEKLNGYMDSIKNGS